jgi:hypothetical protein
MFHQTSEKTMHRVRWILTMGWLILIVSLFYDPISPWLTAPDHFASPLRAKPEVCIQVQNVCLAQDTYGLGAPVFWGLIVPSAILILLIFGHELWRRICPLSFLSQIPRALGLQRKIKRVSSSGVARFEIARVGKDSWLARNYLYLQFGYFFVGLCCRILFINADRLALAIWLLATIAAAIAVGYFYGGKSWCNYFCPMAPVQKIYGEPRGLLNSQAHISDSKITQSMCRIVDEDGQEKSACVACQSPCIDIDAERTYWNGVNEHDRKLLYYGYVGLVIGYFVYYYLYAGNWQYYMSGIWAYETNQLGTLFAPGFYIFGRAIAIPKLVAVPLTLAGFTAIGYFGGRKLEQYLQQRWGKHLSTEQIQHRLFTLCTFFIFNFFFIFAARSWLALFPAQIQYLWELILITTSSIWLYQTWRRDTETYSRESLANRLRKQLAKLDFNIDRWLEGKSLATLNADEVYVLAKVLPGFTKEKRYQAYKEVLQESLAEGYVDSANSLSMLAQMRSELNISDDEHVTIMTELGIEDPDLLDPERRRSLENQVRLTGYRRALERMLRLQQTQSIYDLLQENPGTIRRLRQDYCITYQDEEEILSGLEPEAGVLRRAKHLLGQLEELIERYHALNQPLLRQYGQILNLLRSTVKQKKRLLVRGLLEMIETTEDRTIANQIAHDLGGLAPGVLQDVLENPNSQWSNRLDQEQIMLLRQPEDIAPTCSMVLSDDDIIHHLRSLLSETNPVTQIASLYIIHLLSQSESQQAAQQLLDTTRLEQPVRAIAAIIANPQTARLDLSSLSLLEKLVYLFNTDLFAGMHSDTLLELANLSYINVYEQEAIISDEGDVCRELLLLIEGIVQIQVHDGDGNVITSSLVPGQLLDELEVLSHGKQAGKLIAKHNPTRILATPVDAFDHLLDRDHDFARRVLELESRRLKQLIAIS